MSAGPWFADFKANSLDDGPGIRGVVFFKGCPLSCTWCHNPECADAGPVVTYDAAKCVNDGACLVACEHAATIPPRRSGAVGPLPSLGRGHNASTVPSDALLLTKEEGRGGGKPPGEMVDRRQLRCPACATVCPSGALEVVGQEWDLSEVLRQIDKFAPFYRNSGGGVTLSGGEATMHLDFAAALAASLRARKLHTLLETCGLFPWAPFAEKLAPSLDAVYYDLKIMDPAAHCQYCGADNAAILENFARLVELKRSGGPTTLARVPLVPGVTTGEANLTAIAAFLRGLGVREVALLPYNPLWTDKATKLGVTVDTTLPTTWMAKTEVERCRGYFEGFTVR